MVVLTSSPLELRGIENKFSQENKIYYMVYCEIESGKPYKFYVNDAKVFGENLKKGDMVVITFELTYYNGYERLNVLKVERSNNA